MADQRLPSGFDRHTADVAVKHTNDKKVCDRNSWKLCDLSVQSVCVSLHKQHSWMLVFADVMLHLLVTHFLRP